MSPDNNSPFAQRILDLTRIEALRTDLTVAIDNLGVSQSSHLTDLGHNLQGALAVLQGAAAQQWLQGPDHGLTVKEYRQYRDAIVQRANALHRRAAAAAAAAGQIADLLTLCEPFPTTAEYEESIDEAPLTVAEMHTDSERQAYLTYLWNSLQAGPAITDRDAEDLRRRFDIVLGRTALGAALRDAVENWRHFHLLGLLGWDEDTFAYAIETARSWDELISLWEQVNTACQEGHINGVAGIRLRDALTARVRIAQDTTDMPPRLTELVTEYDTNGMALSARIRHAENWSVLTNVWEALRPGSDLERLGTVRALLRRVRAMQAAEDPTFSPEGQVLMSELDTWHRGLFSTAKDIAEGNAEAYDTEEAYTILYHAAAAAADTGNVAREHQLIGYIEAARAHGRITADHHTRITATLTPAVKVAPA